MQKKICRIFSANLPWGAMRTDFLDRLDDETGDRVAGVVHEAPGPGCPTRRPPAAPRASPGCCAGPG